MKTRSKISLFGGFVAALLFIAGMSLVEPSCEFQGEMLDDMEIAHIAYTAGTIDISYAHLALAFSENPDVREFAHTMIRDHSAVNEKALGLLKKLNATPKDNSTSQQLLAEAEKFKKELAELDGEAFDKRYAENELGYHQFVNETLETQFIPAVQNEEFKGLLESALETFKIHEQHAERMTEMVGSK